MIRLRVTTGRAGRRAAIRKDILARAVAKSAEDLRDAAREMIGKPGTARRSLPGEPPRVDTGRLRDSLFVRLRKGGLSAEVGTDLEYGRDLEFGTRRVAARPWLQPAFEASKARIAARLAEAARRALRGGAFGGRP